MNIPFLTFILFISLPLTYPQNKTSDTVFTAFWNLENLFDTIDDPWKEDEEFTPSGEKEWTQEKLEKKLFKISRAIRTMNMGRGPDLLGVCEVEHKYLLEYLTGDYLKEKHYQSAYAESPDERGIDNGLIFNTDKFFLLSVSSDTIKLEDDSTRLILNVILKSSTGDTLMIFVNHWPSRRSGEEDSEYKRIKAAEVLKRKILLSSSSNSKVIVLGDFNDEPDNISLSQVLDSEPLPCGSNDEVEASKLYNLSYGKFLRGEGSFKYKTDWNMLDQIIVSGSAAAESGLEFLCGSFQVYKPRFLQTYSGKYKGTPFPTYRGKRFLGGCSDHYPVTAKIILERN